MNLSGSRPGTGPPPRQHSKGLLSAADAALVALFGEWHACCADTLHTCRGHSLQQACNRLTQPIVTKAEQVLSSSLLPQQVPSRLPTRKVPSCAARRAMKAPPVYAVLSTASKDVAHLILDNLPLAALGMLACTSRSWHALLEDAPCTWQTAALREYASSHPAHSAPDVRAYLQQQSLVSSNIASRKCTSWQRSISTDELHSLAVNCSLWVCMRAGRQLLVHSALTGDLLHTWPVPARPYCTSVTWAWKCDSSAIMLPFGVAWRGNRWVADTDSAQLSGVLLVDVHSGGCVTVCVPDPQHLPCQGRVELMEAAWAGAGEHVLLVYVSEESTHFCVHASDGVLCNSIEWVADCGCAPRWQWAPSGGTGYLLSHDDDRAFLWHPAAGAPFDISNFVHNDWGAWSPSNTLLLSSDITSVAMFDSQGVALAPPQDLGFQFTQGVFGHCGLAIAGKEQLSLYTVEGHVLVLCHTLLCSWKKTPRLLFSPDGRHILYVCTALAVISFRTAAERKWPLGTECEQERVSWASDGHIVQCAVLPGRRPGLQQHRLRVLCFE